MSTITTGTVKWFNDHFGFRDFLIRSKTQIDYSVFGMSTRIHVGSDGWLFYRSVMDVEKPKFEKILETVKEENGANFDTDLTAENLKEALKDKDNTTYCLKLDIVKFYPNVNHEILKQLLRKKIKDQDLLWLLDEIIESSEGLPIGNYLSQYFANFYLTYFDHWIKEDLKIKYYFRYADDIIILSKSKSHLHEVRALIKQYLNDNLKLQIKDNYQVFPVQARGIDFVGYVFYHTHVLLRKSIKKRFAKAVSKNASQQTIAAYNGWTKHCNSKNLIKKLLPNDKI